MPFIYGNMGSASGTGSSGTVTAADTVLFTVDEDDGTLEASSETVTLTKTNEV